MFITLVCMLYSVQAPPGHPPDVWQQVKQHCRSSSQYLHVILRRKLDRTTASLAVQQQRAEELAQQVTCLQERLSLAVASVVAVVGIVVTGVAVVARWR